MGGVVEGGKEEGSHRQVPGPLLPSRRTTRGGRQRLRRMPRSGRVGGGSRPRPGPWRAPPGRRGGVAAASTSGGCRPSSGGGCGCWSDDGSSSRSFRCPLGTPRDAARHRGRCGRRDFGVGGGRTRCRGGLRPSSSSAVRFDIIMVSKIHNWNEARTVPPLGASWSADCGGGGGGGGGTPAAAGGGNSV